VSWIHDRFSTYGEQLAAIEDSKAWTYTDLLKALQQQVDYLRSSLSGSKQQVISVTDKTTVGSLIKLLAIAELKQIAHPLPTVILGEEREAQLTIAQTDWLLQEDDIQRQPTTSPKAQLFQQLKAQDAAGLILFSSGTSGQPKGMLHNFNALLNRYQSVQPRQERNLQLLLSDHIGGLDSALRTWFAGSTLILPKQLSPDAVGAAIEAHRATVLPASPTFLNLMLIAGIPANYDCSSLRIIAYGAEPMPQDLLNRIAKAFPQADLQQKFGTSETGTIRIQSLKSSSLLFRINDTDSQWKVDAGELWLRTPSRIIGYLNADDTALEKDGWYRTGDLVDEAEDGYLRIIGRASDLINVGGLKVHPREIENIILEIPEIIDCRVYAMDDPIRGKSIACDLVTMIPDASPLTLKRTLRTHCRGRLANWKVPSTVTIASKLSSTHRLKREP